jgi:hypothetical protein
VLGVCFALCAIYRCHFGRDVSRVPSHIALRGHQVLPEPEPMQCCAKSACHESAQTSSRARLLLDPSSPIGHAQGVSQELRNTESAHQMPLTYGPRVKELGHTQRCHAIPWTWQQSRGKRVFRRRRDLLIKRGKQTVRFGVTIANGYRLR